MDTLSKLKQTMFLELAEKWLTSHPTPLMDLSGRTSKAPHGLAPTYRILQIKDFSVKLQILASLEILENLTTLVSTFPSSNSSTKLNSGSPLDDTLCSC